MRVETSRVSLGYLYAAGTVHFAPVDDFELDYRDLLVSAGDVLVVELNHREWTFRDQGAELAWLNRRSVAE